MGTSGERTIETQGQLFCVVQDTGELAIEAEAKIMRGT